MRIDGRRGLASAALLGRTIVTAILGASCALAPGCNETGPERETAGRVPSEWASAALDARTGGRTLEDRQAALTRFQEGVIAAGTAIPFPHYADSTTVVIAVKSAFIELAIRRRLRVLLEHEAKSDLEVLAITDAPVDRVAAALGSARTSCAHPAIELTR